MELQAKTLKIFEFKGVIWKIFRNKDLAPQAALKMGGAASRAVFGTAAPLHCPNQISIVARGGLCVCDGAHRLIVMKNP
jgi:hypothetical protein